MKCGWCNGSGKFKVPVDKEAFEDEFDRLDVMGYFSHGECREKALKVSGYTVEECPECHGTGEIN